MFSCTKLDIEEIICFFPERVESKIVNNRHTFEFITLYESTKVLKLSIIFVNNLSKCLVHLSKGILSSKEISVLFAEPKEIIEGYTKSTISIGSKEYIVYKNDINTLIYYAEWNIISYYMTTVMDDFRYHDNLRFILFTGESKTLPKR